MSYIVIAEFAVKPDELDSFVKHMRQHAEYSRAEPGCQLFEVAQDAAIPSRVVLFERYTDEAAYIEHRATPHYARFREWAPAMLEKKDGQIFQSRSVLSGI